MEGEPRSCFSTTPELPVGSRDAGPAAGRALPPGKNIFYPTIFSSALLLYFNSLRRLRLKVVPYRRGRGRGGARPAAGVQKREQCVVGEL